jgi:hypothetical protein
MTEQLYIPILIWAPIIRGRHAYGKRRRDRGVELYSYVCGCVVGKQRVCRHGRPRARWIERRSCMNTQICGRDRELELEPRFEAESMIVPSFVRDSQGSHRGPSLSWLTSASDQRDSPAQSETRLVHYRELFSMENQNLSLTKRMGSWQTTPVP